MLQRFNATRLQTGGISTLPAVVLRIGRWLARLPRLHVPGAFYHATLRSRQRTLFPRAADHLLLEDFVADALQRTGMSLHAYCWLPHEIRLLIQVRDVPLGQFMQRIGTRYARAVHGRLRGRGHVFEGRYQATLLDARRYLVPMLRDIHLAPVRSGLVNRVDSYRWSSHDDYLGRRSRTWITVDHGLAMIHADRRRAQAAYRALLAASTASVAEISLDTRDGLDSRVLGGADFLAELGSGPVSRPSATTLDQLVRQHCRDYGVTKAELRSASQSRLLTRVRGLIAARVREANVATLAQVGRLLNRSTSALSRAADRYTV
jgi:putative transposase